ncbi:MAG TPA: dTDP-4-dehydrorhamnose 3,5-epimerase [Burkholderiaceae bacterium]|jgi:dTDP-4-dehydrorhamnose 3,5-epimerase|nr:dTDP-4-dehydrorhamnose 3,5-epimerase [Burkholderiaceae bacterium]
MKVQTTSLQGVLVLEPKVFTDARGLFFESFNAKAFRQATGAEVDFVQDNQSRSVRNVMRGIHYQVVRPQGKLVRVASGRIFDVAVDLRRSSTTFSRWVGVELSADNGRQLWIPAGFGHAFLALSDSADVLYKTTEYWYGEYDRSVLWSDPALAIRWPLDGTPTVSEKDACAPLLAQAQLFD